MMTRHVPARAAEARLTGALTAALVTATLVAGALLTGAWGAAMAVAATELGGASPAWGSQETNDAGAHASDRRRHPRQQIVFMKPTNGAAVPGPGGSFEVAIMNLDGSGLRQLTSDGTFKFLPHSTPTGREQSGDADPGWSADGETIYSSRGFPVPPANGPPGSVERKLYAFSSDPWYPGKPEADRSLRSQPSCIEGVPKGSPDGKSILLFRGCFDAGRLVGGIYVTDTAGSYRTFITEGFGPDWNPRPVSSNHK